MTKKQGVIFVQQDVKAKLKMLYTKINFIKVTYNYFIQSLKAMLVLNYFLVYS